MGPDSTSRSADADAAQAGRPEVTRDERFQRRPKVDIDGVRKRFGDEATGVLAIEEVSMQVGDGEFVAIVGPSGCGKSTLLRLVAELQEPTGGEIRIHERDEQRPATAMVFQEHALFPWLTVEHNVMFGPRNRGVDKETCREQAAAQLRRLGLSDFAKSYPHQLSGGMKQRVGIARALAHDPEILLMDEPLGALDAQTRTLLQEQILELREESSPTCLYVTHAIDEAVFLADRVVLMTARPGRIKEVIDVPFATPRAPDLRGTAEFAQLSQEIWEHLRDEVQQSMAAMEG
jgi:NitT/TauT family transport system ATP-binding protein